MDAEPRLTSRETLQIAGRGTIKVIDNPSAESGIYEQILRRRGLEIEVDGSRFQLLDIEGHAPMLHAGKSDALRFCKSWGLVVREVEQMKPCPDCGHDECSYQHEDEPCYGQIRFETRDEYELHSCDGHRGSGDFGLKPGERRYKPKGV